MSGFLIATTLWMTLLLGGWLLVGRSLGRISAAQRGKADDEILGKPDTHATSARSSTAPVYPHHLP